MAGVAYRPRYTVRDYLSWKGDWELWDGVAVSMSPSPNLQHQAVARRLVVMLDRALNNNPACRDCQLYYELDWHIDEGTVVRPDVLVVCTHVAGDWIDAPPSFTAEILSPATADKDRTAKRALYESQGVQVYLIVDPDRKAVELLVLGKDGRYASAPPDADFELHPGCRLAIDPTALW